MMAYIDRPKPETGLAGKFSWQYTLAVALLDGRVGIDSFTDQRRFQADMKILLGKNTIEMDEHIPGTLEDMHVELTVTLKNGEELLERLQATGRVRLMIFGHVHQPYDAEHHGIQVIGTPSTCSQFKPGSEDFTLDDRPPAYRRITLQSDGGCDTELIWVDE